MRRYPTVYRSILLSPDHVYPQALCEEEIGFLNPFRQRLSFVLPILSGPNLITPGGDTDLKREYSRLSTVLSEMRSDWGK